MELWKRRMRRRRIRRSRPLKQILTTRWKPSWPISTQTVQTYHVLNSFSPPPWRIECQKLWNPSVYLMFLIEFGGILLSVSCFWLNLIPKDFTYKDYTVIVKTVQISQQFSRPKRIKCQKLWNTFILCYWLILNNGMTVQCTVYMQRLNGNI